MSEISVIKKDWRKIDLSFGLVYPNYYELGISSYTIRLLYYFINSNENYVCERIFLPKGIRFPASKDHTSDEYIRSIENKITPIDFDILGFSIHYENDFKNILWILEKSGIPLYSHKRREIMLKEGFKYPLIIGGGHVITSNPLPLNDIFDLFFVGDCEPNLNLFLTKFLKFKTGKINFQELLQDSKLINGIYVPSLNNKTRRAILNNIDESPIPIFQLISKAKTNKKIFDENFFIEINRGCPFQCKFCISSFHNSPFRNRSYENVRKTIEEAIVKTQFEKISLIGSCVSSHPKFYEICDYIVNQGKKLSIPSIRIDHLTPKIIRVLERANIKSITIAPEAGTEALRYSLGKKISNNKIMEVLEQIKESEIRNVKLYFLIGLPDERDEDIKEIINLLNQISDIGFETNSLRVNINPFVPKFNTPYENKVDFYLRNNLKLLISKFQVLEKVLKKIPTIKLKFQNPKEIVKKAKMQTIFSLGDKTISELLIKYYLYGGNLGALRRAEKETGISIDNYLLKVNSSYKPWKF
ncbi:MAG: B12-binding domain-containing radical SAM protein [Promethearchaeota archaeon]